MRTSIIILLAFLLSCNNQNEIQEQIQDNESIAIAVMYQQLASEYKALCYQAYNNASNIIKQSEPKQNNLAIILDLDETVLDNSPFEVITLTENINYPECWDEWCLKGDANLVPGVKDFLKLADSLGYEIFYVSNRKIHLLDATVKNLKMYDLPNSEPEFILLRDKESNKDPRRNLISDQGYEIKMLIGDNLGDFSNEFQVEDNEKRDELVKIKQNKFGTEYIVLPNPMYGKWLENTGFYTAKNRDSLYNELLKGFECK